MLRALVLETDPNGRKGHKRNDCERIFEQTAGLLSRFADDIRVAGGARSGPVGEVAALGGIAGE